MKRLKQFSVIAAAAAVAACGGGDEALQPAKAPALPLVADAAQPPQAAVTWTPTGAGLMEWAEATYPQYFPGGQINKSLAPYTYRYYPSTGNYLAYSSDGGVYLHGNIAGGRLTRVGSFSDFTCQINPLYCVAAAAPAVLPPATGGTSPTGSFLPGVTAVLNSPRRIDAEVMQGTTMSNATLSGSATGNLSSLAGRTLYVIVEDPHSLFVNPPTVSLFSTSVSVSMRGRTLSTPGLMEGNLKVHVCLDAACGTLMGGSPLLVPYRVLVTTGLAVSHDSVTVAAGFGEVPADRTIAVTLPQYTTGWIAQLTTGGLLGKMTVSPSNLRGNIGGNIVLSFQPAAPGTYTDVIRLSGSINNANSFTTSSFTKDIPVTYTVNPNASVDVAIHPVETRVARQLNDQIGAGIEARTAVANTGVTLINRGVEYVSAPAGASSGARAATWWNETSAGGSASSCPSFTCLPAGTYTARVRYQVTKAGVSTDVYHPITMQILP